MSALRKGVADESVAAAKRFTRECMAFQLYAPLTGEFNEGPGQHRTVYKSLSGQQIILAVGPASKLYREKE